MSIRERSSIDKMSIPDDDVQGWIGTLKQGGFSNEEIDGIMNHLNETYFLNSKKTEIEKELTKTVQYIQENHRRIVTPEQREYLRQGIEQRLKGMAGRE